MNHIYQDKTFGENWFTYKNLYKSMVEKFNSGSIFVEVGCWKGKSSAYLAVEILNSGKNIKLNCIDTWKGSVEHLEYEHVKKNTLYDLFINNVSPLLTIINPIRMESVDASKIFEDNSIDFIFIDASHDYNNVKSDIKSWYPKLKNGGVIAGHDYNNWKGVEKAVNEFFINKDFLISEECWIHEKII